MGNNTAFYCLSPHKWVIVHSFNRFFMLNYLQIMIFCKNDMFEKIIFLSIVYLYQTW